ncbi:putative endopeptidase/peptidoglycan hydrolase [Rhodanobacter fulvus Jip2]|uniref:Putative endopeptidase/peptidoglycan hydrolase n=1 Tax=Rhodanobacter fulvus Jip2 TaxID=1163408 RepID=I4VTW5_9GAMM|nr:M23 family metallopeptidase [Rhodanobacter fulvus]EIL90656.1 putative endopeptidase/peptidoglycan hydrolase [Rhodanobacter fulvus Jip2]
MKVLIGFVLGAVCAVVAMLNLGARGPVPAVVQDDPPRAISTAAAMDAPPPPVAAATVPPVAATTAIVRDETAPAAPASAIEAAPDISGLPASAISGLLMPVVGVKTADLVDTYTQARQGRGVHDAIDIMAARGTPVVAVNDGEVVKLFDSVRGGLTVYQFGPQQRVVYYYAHLDRYAPGLAEGQMLHRGDPIGFVGSTGNASADAPHLHFEIGVLGPEKHWWQSRPINPYGRIIGP